ncbi:hypothetical protein MFLAVUS_001655 [Mucor flavus]|uniref:PIG-P domain-containing protein n=1 Tax=Mucor flavus TaxID=439312 RepID=A0ABP9YN32_9FUNG
MEQDNTSIAAKRFLARNQKTLSTSRSTTSLPDLVNHAITSATASLSKRQVANLSTSMRRGHSQQTQVSAKILEQPKKQTVSKRRHSFSSFLNARYGKTAIVDEETRNYKGSTTTTSTHINFTSPMIMTGSQGQKPIQGKKGHRPRSYSEVSFNLPQVERAPPVAITNKTPAYEYYGFVMYLGSFVILGIYLIWAYVPDEILHRLGITYYPNRYWALAVPIWLMTIIWFIFFSFMSLSLLNTPPFTSYHCITDEHANLMRLDSEMVSDRPSDWIPELHDIPIGLVNAILYQTDFVIPTNSKKTSSSHHILHNNSLIDSADEMSEADALALMRKRGNKTYYKK